MARYQFTVTVHAQYLPDQSAPDDARYVFAYTIGVKNTGQVAAQLISRHWVIMDANDHVTEVRGLGVVGQQPFLKPGQEFEYTSGTPLATPVGTMRGEFFCVAEDGTQFDAPVLEFTLAMPRTLH